MSGVWRNGRKGEEFTPLGVFSLEVAGMWHRLQILISKEQLKWLKEQAFKREKSIGKIVRELIDRAMKK